MKKNVLLAAVLMQQAPECMPKVASAKKWAEKNPKKYSIAAPQESTKQHLNDT
ncbi:MAG: hypothetical protein KatS3mg028_1097 [Bacteroidia bacterium]|nr:MAG: hypothetical protein KatS3mg028_1097 [Bacteroidia bacterium]